MTIKEIVAEIISTIGLPRSGFNTPFVEITGGEPLAQSDTIPLLTELASMGYEVALETAGSHDIKSVPRSVIKIMDRKTPGSGASRHWLESNLEFMVREQDELKFVLCSRDDYYWSKDWCETRDIFDHINTIFSSAWGMLDSTWLAEKIIQDRIHVRFQLQLHKLIWSPDKRGV